MKADNIYPDTVINGVRKSLEQANEGNLSPYIGIKDMLLNVNNKSGKALKYFNRKTSPK